IHRDYLADMKCLLDFAPVSWPALALHSMVQEARQRLAAIEAGRPLSASDQRFLAQLVPVARTARHSLRDPASYPRPSGARPCARRAPPLGRATGPTPTRPRRSGVPALVLLRRRRADVPARPAGQGSRLLPRRAEERLPRPGRPRRGAGGVPRPADGADRP